MNEIIGLILATGITMFITVILGFNHIGQKVVFDWKSLVIFGIIAVTNFVYKKFKKKALSPIVLILISAVLGIIFYGLIT